MVGPTGAGKSEAALTVAEKLGALLLSVDSMQVYRGMNIGTAKPNAEERARVPHAMIDLVEPEVELTVAEFQKIARQVIAESDRPVVIAGGSGLHFRAVIDPLEFPPHDEALRTNLEAAPNTELVAELLAADPAAVDLVDLKNPRRVVRAVEILRLTGATPSGRAADPAAANVRNYRPMFEVKVVGVDPGPRLASRIRRRLIRMRNAGLLEEVEGLRGRLGTTASQAVGYKELTEVVDGRIGLDEGFRRVEAATLALVKRQRTYFRRDPRIQWTTSVEEALVELGK